VSLETGIAEEPKIKGFETLADRKVGKARITLLRQVSPE
jgi:hypothetical protein